MAQNPSYDKVAVGDTFSSGLQSMGDRVWGYKSLVLEVGPIETRFGQPDRVVAVKIQSTSGNVVDASKKIWVSQLLKGLV